ncbi:hypothetical protein IP95_01491 [Extensimonas vulgaris]|uniref:Uncharacterized protein n=1 Tax=Extensimonas vulgaris TaxID=1031594 RepID=A0A369ARG6_9BURK|nr:hypothetical protein DFR45_101497 [Extensimonas vulgaris]TWI38950.1 hypothetical protein IP95_01491 [Extensimonas vulgaris]TXD14952.1 hypothetical protein FUT63_08270 [Extensimonas vulgaris]
MGKDQPATPPANAPATGDKRTAVDRRQVEQGPPTRHERRRSIERRQPEVEELHLSPEALEALGFTPPKSAGEDKKR